MSVQISFLHPPLQLIYECQRWNKTNLIRILSRNAQFATSDSDIVYRKLDWTEMRSVHQNKKLVVESYLDSPVQFLTFSNILINACTCIQSWVHAFRFASTCIEPSRSKGQSERVNRKDKGWQYCPLQSTLCPILLCIDLLLENVEIGMGCQWLQDTYWLLLSAYQKPFPYSYQNVWISQIEEQTFDAIALAWGHSSSKATQRLTFGTHIQSQC